MLILPELVPLLHPFLVATGPGSDPSFINPAPDPFSFLAPARSSAWSAGFAGQPWSAAWSAW